MTPGIGSPEAEPAPWPPVEVGGASVSPGQRRRIEIPTARLATGSPLPLPVEVIHGRRPGPRVWISAAIHGDELNGIEIVRQVLTAVRPHRLSGTLLAVPIVNVFGFITQSRYLPDRRDLNRAFPGSPRGSLASRIAHLLMREVVKGCHAGIDFHSGSAGRTNIPQVRADLSCAETRRLAEAFGAPIRIHASVRDGSLRAAATARGAHVLVYEGGEAGRFDRAAIEAGTLGVFRVLDALGLRRHSGGGAPPDTLESRRTAWVRAGRSGLARLDVEPGERVRRGQRLGVIQDASGERGLGVRAPFGGIVIGLALQPHVHRGDALVHIAAVEANGGAVSPRGPESRPG